MLLLVAVMCVQLVACGGNEESSDNNDDPVTEAPSGETNKPSGETNKPSGETNKPSGETNKPSGETNKPSGETTTPPLAASSAEIVKNGASDFVIVYPADAAEDTHVQDVCTALVNAFNAKFGVTLSCVPDSTEEVAKEILVGMTNRKQTIDVVTPLRTNDGVATVVDGKVVLVSRSGESLVALAGDFIEVINEAVGNSMSFHSKNALQNVGKYDIQSMLISGASVEEFVLVVPEMDGLEHYVARILQRHIKVNAGYILEIVDDDTEVAAHEIRIGKTSRTVTEVAEGEYAVIPADGHMEIAFDDMYAVGALAYTLTTQYFNRTAWKLDIKLTEDNTKVFVGNKWDADAQGNGIIVGTFEYDARVTTTEISATAPKADAGDLRVMYHDVNGHINLEATSVVSSANARATLLIETYKAYMPDILCLAEAGQDFPTEAAALFTWLEANGYKMFRDDAKGLALPIFYNTARVSLITANNASGYLAREQGGTKGVTYATFRDNENGEIFGVVSVHYSSDSDVYGTFDEKNEAEANLAFIAGSKAREEESQLVLQAIDKIRSANKTATAVFVGGNFNTTRGEYAVETDEYGIETLIEPLLPLTDDGLVEVRDKDELPEENNAQIAPYDGGSKLSYDEEFNYVSFTKANGRPAEEELDKNGKVKYPGSADFIFFDGKAGDFDAKMYEVVTDVVAATSSDHLPHFIDIAWN